MSAEVKDSLAVKELITGDYTATPAAASAGFILIKDGGGVTRKVMIQA